MSAYTPTAELTSIPEADRIRIADDIDGGWVFEMSLADRALVDTLLKAMAKELFMVNDKQIVRALRGEKVVL